MNLPLSYYSLSGLVNCLTSLTFGTYLCIKAQSTTVRVFGFWCLSVAGWSFGYFFWQVVQTSETALFWTKFLMFFAIIIPVLILHFTFEFLDLLPRKKLLLSSYYLVSIVYLVADVQTHAFISGVEQELMFPYWPKPGLLFHPYLAMFFASVSYCHFLLWRHMQHASRLRRTQIQYVFWGVFIAFIGGSTNFPLWYEIPIPPIGNALVMLYVFVIAYAILKHQLLDITIVIRRALIYSTLTACITIGYFLVIFAAQQAFATLMGYQSFLIALASALALAVSFMPLKNRIQSLVDRLFFRKTQLALVEENFQLWQEVSRAEQLRAAGTLASGVAHELRNPLTSVQTFCELMSERHTDPAYRAKFQAIVPKELRRIQGILDDMLAFARPRELQREAVALPQLIQETLDLLSHDFLRRRIELTTNFAGAPPIHADPTRVKQVVLNLVLNALQAMGTDGKLSVWVRPEGGGCCLTIADTGPGLPPEIEARLGEPFLTTRQGGTGILLPFKASA